MPKFLALIYGDEQVWADASPEWIEQNYQAHSAFAEQAGDAVIGGLELEPTAQSVCVRGTNGGGPTTTDGPFVETKEAIGGYYLLEAPDLAEAVRLAALIPEASVPGCGVEVRASR